MRWLAAGSAAGLAAFLLAGLATFLVVGFGTALTGCAQPREPAAFVVADPDPNDTARVAPARWPGFPLLPNGRFPVAGWCAPPVSQTTDERYEEYAQAGFTVVLNALEDPHLEGPNRRRLEVAARHGLYCVIRDGRMHPHVARFSGWRAVVDTVAATYRDHPALLAYFLADEPQPEFFAILGSVMRRLAQRDPRHPAHVNLFGQGPLGSTFQGLCFSRYVRDFLDVARPSFFSMDNYVLGGDREVPTFCSGWDTTRTLAGNVPYWAVILLTPHAGFREVTEAELAWQANLALAHGARGIVWFTYWSPDPNREGNYRGGPISYEGRRNPRYAVVSRLNAEIQRLGLELSPLRCLEVRHSGRPPLDGRALAADMPVRVDQTGGRPADLALGFFAGGSDRQYVLVVNRDYRNRAEASLVSRAVLERWTGSPGRYAATRPTATAAGHSLRVALEPGRAGLFRLGTTGSSAKPGARAAPSEETSP